MNSNPKTKFVSSPSFAILDDFGRFIGQGGTANLRNVFSKCLTINLILHEHFSIARLNRVGKEIDNLFFQRNISYVFNSRLVREAILANKHEYSILHPIPRAWQHSFADSGFRLRQTSCHLAWKLSNYKKAALSVLSILKTNVELVSKSKNNDAECSPQKVTVFTSFAGDNVLSTEESEGYTFGNWLKQNHLFKGKVLNFVSPKRNDKHTANLDSVKEFNLARLPIRKIDKAKLYLEIFYFLLYGFLKCLIGKPELLSMGNEIVDFLISEKTLKSELPDYIFFTEGDGVMRPLWTYEAEKKGRDVIHIFFSNCDSPKIHSESSSNLQLYSCATWSQYWTIDAFQRDQLMKRTTLNISNFHIAGFPWRSDLRNYFPIDERRIIAVFDYETLAGVLGFGTIHDVGYHNQAKEILFLSNLVECASGLNLVVVHKPKRLIPREKRSDEYADLLVKLETNSNYVSVDPRTSATRLIQASNCVVSLPMTSTALLGKHLQKPTFFYDPIGRIDKNDEALRNIPLIQSKSELHLFLSRIP